MTQEIAAQLDGAPVPTHFADGKANAVITSYLDGQMVRVSRENRKWKKSEQPDLVKLTNCDDVWEMCFRVPPPGWRLFGRFLDRSLYIGLRLSDKIEVGSDYSEEIDGVIAEWNRRFPKIDPVRSGSLSDYLSAVWRDIDVAE